MADEHPVLDQINLVVSDMAATVAFYRRLGLSVPDRHTVWDQHHRTPAMPDAIEFEFDSAEFAPKWNAGWSGRAGRGGVVLGFRVSSRAAVDRVHAALLR